jgi:hypothetical protein
MSEISLDSLPEIVPLGGSAPPAVLMEEFLESAHSCASVLCTQHLAFGLLELHVTRTPTQFLALGLLENDENGNLVPRAFPVLPVRPQRPANNANAAALSLYREDTVEYFDIMKSISALRLKIIGALGTVIVDELRAQPGGLAAQTLPMILLFLERTYGVPNEQDIVWLLGQLSIRFVSVNSFRSDAPRMKLNFNKLARFNQPVADLQQQTHLQTATELIPPIVEAIKNYKHDFPVLQTRSFDAMVDYIKVHVPNTTAGDLGYVGAVVHPVPPAVDGHHPGYPVVADLPGVDPHLLQAVGNITQAFLMQHFAGFAPNTRAPVAAGRGGRGGAARGGGRGGRGGRGRGDQPAVGVNPQFYCFRHGQCAHPGSTCFVMAGDNTYTAAMKAAVGPGVIDGYAGHP